MHCKALTVTVGMYAREGERSGRSKAAPLLHIEDMHGKGTYTLLPRAVAQYGGSASHDKGGGWVGHRAWLTMPNREELGGYIVALWLTAIWWEYGPRKADYHILGDGTTPT